MSKVKITGHASGSGTITLTGPNTSSDRTITLPDATGTALMTDGSGASLTALNATNLGSGTVPTARLGTGTADAGSYLRGDGAWEAGFSKVGLFTYDTSTASGTQAITGVGFTPSALTLFAAQDTAGQASYGIGAPSINYCVVDKQAWVNNYWVPTANIAIYMIQSSSINCYGVVNSFDADGFTMGWTKTGSKTGTVHVYYMAVR